MSVDLLHLHWKDLFPIERGIVPVTPEDYNQIVAAINSKYKDGIRRGNEQVRVSSISTGSPELDVAMGGGVPQGRFTRFYGGYGSTKTTTAYSVIAEAQRIGLLCAYYNIEKRYEAGLAERLGVRTKELTLVPGATIEAVAEKMENLLGVVHLHVLDSCTMATSEDELIADVREWRPGIQARAWGKAFRRLNERFDQTDNTCILIDQMRLKKTGGRSSEWIEDPAGGRVFDFVSSMSVLFRTGKWLWRDGNGGFTDDAKKMSGSKTDTIDDQISPQGREIKIRVEKSSVCRPFRTATLHYDLDTLEYDRVYEYMKAAVYYNVVRQSGSYYYYQPKRGEAVKMHGEKQLREWIAQNKLIQKTIHKIALEAAQQ